MPSRRAIDIDPKPLLDYVDAHPELLFRIGRRAQSLRRTLNRAREGGAIAFSSVDEICCRMHVHMSEIYGDVYWNTRLEPIPKREYDRRCHERYRTDPAYHEKKTEQQRRRREQRKERRKDPIWRERELERHRLEYQRAKADPTYPERRAEHHRRQRERYQTDTAYRERELERQRLYRERCRAEREQQRRANPGGGVA